MLLHALAKNWWLTLLRGILAIVFAIFAFTNPGVTLASLILVVGAFALIEGVLAIVSAFRARDSEKDWWVTLIEGLLAVAFGLLTFYNPLITTLVLLFYVAAWAIVGGSLKIAAAVRLRRVIEGEFWLILSGILSVAFGVLMMALPGAGAIAMLFYIGAWALVTGVTLVLLSFKLKGLERRIGDKREGPGPHISAPAH